MLFALPKGVVELSSFCSPKFLRDQNMILYEAVQPSAEAKLINWIITNARENASINKSGLPNQPKINIDCSGSALCSSSYHSSSIKAADYVALKHFTESPIVFIFVTGAVLGRGGIRRCLV